MATFGQMAFVRPETELTTAIGTSGTDALKAFQEQIIKNKC